MEEYINGEYITRKHNNGTIETFLIRPVVTEETPVYHWKITQLAFKNRFPRDKWKAAKALRALDADIDDFFESFELATYINLEEPETIASVNALGIESIPESIRLTSEEIAAVLTIPAQPKEMFNG